MFFDKILASYFMHLGKVGEVLSISDFHTKSYFTQVIKDIKGVGELVQDYPFEDDDKLTNTLFEQQDNSIERRNEVLDHLLSRFAEKFGDYAFLMKSLYGSTADEIVLSNKEFFVKDYISISSERGSGFNYYKQMPSDLWDTSNISGFQKRIARLLGVKNYSRRHLSKSPVDIYSLTNSKGEVVFRWRITDLDDEIILNSTDDYPTKSLANKELYFSVLQIIETSEKEVLKAFESNATDEFSVGNIHVHKSDSGKYSFDIINPLVENTKDVDWIIAKQYRYHNSLEKAKLAILRIIDFMKLEFTEEGIFLVEHILLRPDVTKESSEDVSFLPICTDNCSSCEIDPYSYKVSIVLPGYTYRFSDPNFREYAEQVIKEELPAHIIPKICWVGHRENYIEKRREEGLRTLEEQRTNYLKNYEKGT